MHKDVLQNIFSLNIIRNMKFQKISCSESLRLIECINPRRDVWAVRWNHNRDTEKGWVALEAIVNGRPSVEDIRAAIDEYIDNQTQENIRNGFSWNGHPIRLTDTAQRNFLFAVYSLEKTGEIDRASFIGLLEAETDAAAADELGDMVAAMWKHIERCRNDGKERKMAVDYSHYELDS